MPAYSKRTCRNSRSPSGRDAKLVGELLDHVADAGDGGVDDERVAAAGAQRTDPQRQRARAGLEGHVDGAVQHVRGRAGGDQVGDQHRVVQAVERQVGARGEHADDAAEDRADERPGGDRNGRRRVRADRARRHAASPGRCRANVIATRLPPPGTGWSSTSSAIAAISGRPRPGPVVSELVPMPRP